MDDMTINEGIAFAVTENGQWHITITDASRRRRLHGPETFLWDSNAGITLERVAQILPEGWTIDGEPFRHKPFVLIVRVRRTGE
jgi:hypothetical protein